MTNAIETYENPTSLQPHDLGEAMTLARTLATSGIVPSALRGKPADILVIMMYGMELGLSVNQAMRGINVIKGRPSLSTELRVSKTRERGHRVGVVCAGCGQFADHNVHVLDASGGHRFEADWTRERCTVKAVRKDTGETAVITWTVEDAIGAGLLWPGKGDLEGKLISRSEKGEVLPWEAYTKDMLYARAADRACKQIAPEVGYGLYTREEIDGMPEDPIQVTATAGEPVTADEIRRDAETLRAQAASAQPESVDMEDGSRDAASPLDVTPADPPSASEVDPVTEGQLTKVVVMFNKIGVTDRTERLELSSLAIGRALTSAKDLTKAEARALIDRLEQASRQDDPIGWLYESVRSDATEGQP